MRSLNGVIISGRNIKVGRPSNMPQAQAVIDEIQIEAKNFNRIQIIGIKTGFGLLKEMFKRVQYY